MSIIIDSKCVSVCHCGCYPFEKCCLNKFTTGRRKQFLEVRKWRKNEPNRKLTKSSLSKTHKLSFMVKLLIETASVEYTICSHRQLSADPESRWIHLYIRCGYVAKTEHAIKERLSCTPQLWCVMMLLFSLSLLRGRIICL